MYKPTASVELSTQAMPQIRLLLLGRPGTGKTFSVCTTFPGIIVADFDNGLTSADIRKLGILSMPFYDMDWIKKNFPNSGDRAASAFKAWLNNEARKLEKDQTLFIDSLSALDDSFHIETEKLAPAGKSGERDGFFVWNQKQVFFRDIHNIFKALKCNVVVAAHEKEERDADSGALLGKVSPLMTGVFASKLGSQYTDVVRTFSKEERDAAGKPTGKTIYQWQVKSDDKYDLKSRMTHASKFVEPGYGIFQKGY